MEILLNPNIAYLLLAGGLVLAVLALLSPGSGVLEIGALAILGLAGYCMYYLPVNWWALGIVILGIALFLIALRRPGQYPILVASIACLVLGSTFIFRSDIWFIPAVNPILALIVSLLSAGFFWIATKKVMEARAIQPTHDLQALIGATGTAKTNIQADGSVQVAGELWTARSKTPIPRGAHVRVIGRDGFVLEVESIKKGSS